MRFLRITAVLLLMLVLYATWPPNEEHINIVVSYKAEPDTAGLEVFFSAGLDNKHSRTLQPGKRHRTLLIPGRAATYAPDRRLYMSYHPQGTDIKAAKGWYGPELPMDVSYRIAIGIHPDGRVTHHYCIKPCKLSNPVNKSSP